MDIKSILDINVKYVQKELDVRPLAAVRQDPDAQPCKIFLVVRCELSGIF
ncbi:hypothetical protein [Desulfobacter sp.]